jgi:predicted transcriptional regulator
MKDERITFKTAKFLKEKKFDITVYGCYTEFLINQNDPEYPKGGGPFSMVKGEIEFENDYMKNNDKSYGDYSCKNYTMYAAPTQSLVQKWLREVHNIQVYCYSSSKNSEGKYRDYVVHINEKSINDDRDEEFQTYEEALEVGLQVALEMI